MVWRVLAYCSASSRQRCIRPTASAAIIGRERSNTFMAIRKPAPSPSISEDTGTCTSFKKTSAAGAARCPSLPSGCPTLKPGVSRFTKNALMPLCPACASVLANTTNIVASVAFEIHTLLPLST